MGTISPTTASNQQSDGGARATLSYIQEVDVRPTPLGDELICEMVAPTGTRIAQERCYFKSEAFGESTAEAARRNEIDTLRQEQLELEERYLESITLPRSPCRGC